MDPLILSEDSCPFQALAGRMGGYTTISIVSVQFFDATDNLVALFLERLALLLELSSHGDFLQHGLQFGELVLKLLGREFG